MQKTEIGQMEKPINEEFPSADADVSPVETVSSDFETLKVEVIKGIARALELDAENCESIINLDERRGVDFYEEVTKFEVDLIRQALAHTNGNQCAAARLLGLKTTTLHTKVKSYKLDVDSQAA